MSFWKLHYNTQFNGHVWAVFFIFCAHKPVFVGNADAHNSIQRSHYNSAPAETIQSVHNSTLMEGMHFCACGKPHKTNNSVFAEIGV